MQLFEPVPLPDDIERGEVGACFDTCALLALKSKGKYEYCEGMVHIIHPGQTNEWLYHAWLTDKDHKYAYDPTWLAVDDYGVERAIPGLYKGVVLPIGLVAEFMKQSGYQGIFANKHRAPDVYKKIELAVTK